jgi:metallo-beta-lactamase family protein
VIESTYGDRRHPTADSGIFAGVIRRTADRRGVVLVPAFAVDRTELVLLEVHRLIEAGEIPRLSIFVDSPMALAALDGYRRALRQGSPELRPDRAQALDALDDLDLHQVRDAEHSELLNRPAVPCIIVSASGMATGGRVVHHLACRLPDPRNSVVLTGYQAEGHPWSTAAAGGAKREDAWQIRACPRGGRAEVVLVRARRCGRADRLGGLGVRGPADGVCRAR